MNRETNRVECKEKLTDDFEKVAVAFLKPRLDKKYLDPHALREAVVNAFVHNDYSRGDTPIFEIFEDRIEITTYGNVLDLMSEEEFFTGRSAPRNPEIMRIFQDLELVEHLGSGIPYIVGLYGRKAFEIGKAGLRLSLMFDKGAEQKTNLESREKSREKTTLKSREKTDLKSREKTTMKTDLINAQQTPCKRPDNTQETTGERPENVQKTTLKTTLKSTLKSKEKTDLKSREKSKEKNQEKSKEKIFTIIKQKPRITTNELASILKLSMAGVEKNIRQLKEQNKIHRVGPAKGGHWEVVGE